MDRYQKYAQEEVQRGTGLREPDGERQMLMKHQMPLPLGPRAFDHRARSFQQELVHSSWV